MSSVISNFSFYSISNIFARLRRQKSQLRLEERLHLYGVLLAYNKSNVDPEKLFARKRRDGSDRMHRAFAGIKYRLDLSDSLSDALKDYIPYDEHIFIESASRQYDISDMLKNLIFMVEKKHEQMKKFKSSAVVPAVTYGVSLFILTLIVFALGPQAFEIVGVDSKKMLWVRDAFYPFMTILLPALIVLFPAFIVGIVWALPNVKRYGIRKYLDKIPPFNLYKRMMASQFLVVTASAIQGRISFTESLNLQRNVSPSYLRSWLETLRQRFMSGHYSDTDAMDVGFLSDGEMDMLEDFSSTSSFSNAMIILGKESLEKTLDEISNRFRIISILTAVSAFLSILFCVGIFVGYIYVNTSTGL